MLPRAMPMNRLTMRLIMGLLAPTAATAAVRAAPVKFPTTATSEALKSCSSMAVAATGRANRGSLVQMGPWSISSCPVCFRSSICKTIPFSLNSFPIIPPPPIDSKYL